MLSNRRFQSKGQDMRLLQASLYVLCCLQMAACTGKKELKSNRWEQNGPAPTTPTQLEQNQVTQKVGSEKLVLSKQYLEGIEIEGAFLKSISSNNGDLLFSKWAYREQLPNRVKKQKKRMLQNLDHFQRNLKSRHLIFEQYTLAAEPKLFLSAHDELLWKLEYTDQQGQNFAAFFDESLNLIRTLRLSSQFESSDAIGAVYPQGPLKSPIQNVHLKRLTGQKELVSAYLKVLTKSNAPATADQGQFIFDGADERLKQVQVYYDIIESIDWFKNHFQFELAQPLQVEMSMGYPDKTNAAFYFRSKISLGDGDGVVYKDMPLDPSITRHESVHAVIDQIAGLINENESASLNEALADYFTATQRNNPKMGEGSYKKADFKRNLANEMKLGEKNGTTYHDSLLVSGMLWQIRSELGADIADELSWETLKKLQPYSDFKDFALEFLSEVHKLNVDQQNKIKSILAQREWPLSVEATSK